MVDQRELDKLVRTIEQAYKTDKVNRTALLIVHGKVTKRIFQDGINAKGSLIGTYSPEYQKVRQANNWPISKKVILQATGQMLRDWVLIVENGEYGSGFNQLINFEKSDWMDERFGTIFDLMPNEEKGISKAFEEAWEQLL